MTNDGAGYAALPATEYMRASLPVRGPGAGVVGNRENKRGKGRGARPPFIDRTTGTAHTGAQLAMPGVGSSRRENRHLLK
jgi:hypothetical protein